MVLLLTDTATKRSASRKHSCIWKCFFYQIQPTPTLSKVEEVALMVLLLEDTAKNIAEEDYCI